MTVLFYVITFDSTHKAIRAEQFFMENKTGELIPTPREISASCGLALKCLPEALEEATALLCQNFYEETGIVLYGLYKDGDNRSAKAMEWRTLCPST